MCKTKSLVVCTWKTDWKLYLFKKNADILLWKHTVANKASIWKQRNHTITFELHSGF